jgi:putative membrane protein
MKRLLAFAVFLAGVLVAVGLVSAAGLPSVARALGQVGWSGFAAMLALQIVSLGLCSLAWAAVSDRGGWRAHFLARWIRDGASNLLALLPVVGEVAGARVLSRAASVAPAEAAASTVVDVGVEALAQALYTVGAVLLLVWTAAPRELGRWALVTLLGVAPMLGLFALTRLPAVVSLAERGLRTAVTLTVAKPLGAGPSVAQKVAALHGRRGAILFALLTHLAAWVVGALQLWAASRGFHAPLRVWDAVSMEALAYAGRTALFFVPAAAGLQEGAFVAIGAVLGLSMAESLALSVALRARDLVYGAPALLAWGSQEARWGRREGGADPGRNGLSLAPGLLGRKAERPNYSSAEIES